MTDIADKPTPERLGQDHEDGLSHTVCECRRERPLYIALCGVDVTAAHVCPDSLACGCVPCVVCEDLIDAPCRFCGE